VLGYRQDMPWPRAIVAEGLEQPGALQQRDAVSGASAAQAHLSADLVGRTDRERSIEAVQSLQQLRCSLRQVHLVRGSHGVGSSGRTLVHLGTLCVVEDDRDGRSHLAQLWVIPLQHQNLWHFPVFLQA
jgi:hypothetical protein